MNYLEKHRRLMELPIKMEEKKRFVRIHDDEYIKIYNEEFTKLITRIEDEIERVNPDIDFSKIILHKFEQMYGNYGFEYIIGNIRGRFNFHRDLLRWGARYNPNPYPKLTEEHSGFVEPYICHGGRMTEEFFNDFIIQFTDEYKRVVE